VREFLQEVLPGHTCATAFAHHSGRVLGSLTQDELRRQTRDEEAAGVIWAELRRLEEQCKERRELEEHGDYPLTVFVRTPAEVSMEFEVQPSTTVAELKKRIEAVEGTPMAMQRITRNSAMMLDSRTMASYHVCHGAVLLLVPRMARCIAGGAPAAAPRAVPRATPALSGIPRPRVPLVCTDIARPFPMSLEFEGVPEYQGFMLAIQRQTGRRDRRETTAGEEEAAPFLELLPAINMHEGVETRVTFDQDAEVLLIDTVGDIVMENSRYKCLLHLRYAQKPAVLVTGSRQAER